MEVGEVIILEVEEAPVTVMVSSAPCHLIPLPLLPAVDLLIYSHYIPHLNHLPSLPDNHRSSLLDNLPINHYPYLPGSHHFNRSSNPHINLRRNHLICRQYALLVSQQFSRPSNLYQSLRGNQHRNRQLDRLHNLPGSRLRNPVDGRPLVLPNNPLSNLQSNRPQDHR